MKSRRNKSGSLAEDKLCNEMSDAIRLTLCYVINQFDWSINSLHLSEVVKTVRKNLCYGHVIEQKIEQAPLVRIDQWMIELFKYQLVAQMQLQLHFEFKACHLSFHFSAY